MAITSIPFGPNAFEPFPEEERRDPYGLNDPRATDVLQNPFVGLDQRIAERRGSDVFPLLQDDEAATDNKLQYGLADPASIMDARDELSPTIINAEPSGIVEDAETLDKVRKLVGDIYEKWGYITPEQRTAEGYINEEVDPHVPDSTYFVRKRDGHIVATARLIDKQRLEDFPAVAEFSVNVKALENIDPAPEHYEEVSALVKDPEEGHRDDVLAEYADMMKYSVSNGVRYWLMSVDTRLSGKLRQLFGSKSFKELGDVEFVMGSDTEPMLMDLHYALRLLDKRFVPNHIKDIFQAGLQGVDTSGLDEKTQRILKKHGINQTAEEQTAEQKRHKIVNWAMAGLAGYCIARAGVIPATHLAEEGVNTYVFLGLDLATIPPYAKGLEYFATQGSAVRRIGGAVMSAAAFLTPYAYAAYEAGGSTELLEAGGIWGGTAVGLIGIKQSIKSWRAHHQRTNIAETEPNIVSDLEDAA